MAITPPSQWRDQLSLQPGEIVPAPLFTEQETDAQAPESLLPPPPPQFDDGTGLAFSSAYTDASMLEYRTGLGLGLGVATNSAWSVSQRFPLARGMDLSVYYLHAWGEGPRAGVRTFGIEPADNLGEESAGLRLEWKF